MRILFASAESETANRIKELLSTNNCIADIAICDTDCLSYAEFDIYDVFIIDIQVEPYGGLNLLKDLRDKKNNTPIFIIGHNRSVNETVNALDCGADDYICFPFAPAEFFARLRALARRKNTSLELDLISYGDITLDLNTNELLCNGKIIHLGIKEFQILKLLISSGKQVITKEYMADKVWGINSSSEYNNVEVYISFLRKKLKKINSQATINTIRGSGYRLGSR